jgi:hypothetical protein
MKNCIAILISLILFGIKAQAHDLICIFDQKEYWINSQNGYFTEFTNNKTTDGGYFSIFNLGKNSKIFQKESADFNTKNIEITNVAMSTPNTFKSIFYLQEMVFRPSCWDGCDNVTTERAIVKKIDGECRYLTTADPDYY